MAMEHSGLIRQSLRRHWVKVLLTAGLTIVGLWLLMRIIDINDVLEAIRRSNMWYMGLALLCYAASYLFRALRIQRIYRQQPMSLRGLWQVVAMNNLLNYMLPLRTGDLSLIYFLKRRFGVAIGAGAGIWILARLLDTLTALFCLSVAVAIYIASGGWNGDSRILVFIVVLSILLFVAIWMLPTFWQFGLRILALAQSHIAALRRPWFDRLLAKLAEVTTVLQLGQQRTMLMEQAAISLAVWAALFGFFWLALQSIHLTYLSLPEVVIGSSGAVIINFLPINTFASIGTLEAGWSAGFALIGMPREDMLISGVVVHVWVIVYAVMLACLSLGIDAFAALRSRRSAAHVAIPEVPGSE